jgi:hypothetical protein
VERRGYNSAQPKEESREQHPEDAVMRIQINTTDVHPDNAPGIDFDITFAPCWWYREIVVRFGEALQHT